MVVSTPAGQPTSSSNTEHSLTTTKVILSSSQDLSNQRFFRIKGLPTGGLFIWRDFVYLIWIYFGVYSLVSANTCKDMNNERLKIIIAFNIVRAILVAITSLIFFSMLTGYGEGYQIFLAIFLNPILTFLQILKVYYSYKAKLPTFILTLSILTLFLFYIPLTHFLHLNPKVSIILSGATYTMIMAYYIWESFYIHRLKK
jgi:hypothetical protein